MKYLANLPSDCPFDRIRVFIVVTGNPERDEERPVDSHNSDTTHDAT
jgi:hypothetical protein